MKSLLTWTIVLCILLLSLPILAEEDDYEENSPAIQIAILLDTSSSMDGLIDQAKRRIWNIVNAFDDASKHGENPRIMVALYEYGNTKISSSNGFVRNVVPLTEDLDLVAEELFTLKTQGGNEFCGAAIRMAMDELEWSDDEDDFKTIFIIGNEPFNQGPVDFRETCRSIKDQEILVNTIFCGPSKQGVESGWKEGAEITGGSFTSLDHTMKIPLVKTPVDSNIAELAEALNGTYIPYGKDGAKAKKRQNTIDERSMEVAPESFMERQVTKTRDTYSSASWDLVDAVEAGTVSIAELTPEDLPEELQGMTPEEIQSFIEDQYFERERIRDEMLRLMEERDEYLAQEGKAPQAKPTLDTRVVDILKEQVTAQGFEFE